MQLWDVLAADATGKTDPRVLFSTPEARMVMIDLAAGEELGDHGVHERAIIQVARGSIELTSARGTTTCAQGSVVLLEPGERHAVRASEAARILLTLAPWPGPRPLRPVRDAGSAPPPGARDRARAVTRCATSR